jgi:hypothetical protein
MAIYRLTKAVLTESIKKCGFNKEGMEIDGSPNVNKKYDAIYVRE